MSEFLVVFAFAWVIPISLNQITLFVFYWLQPRYFRFQYTGIRLGFYLLMNSLPFVNYVVFGGHLYCIFEIIFNKISKTKFYRLTFKNPKLINLLNNDMSKIGIKNEKG